MSDRAPVAPAPRATRLDAKPTASASALDAAAHTKSGSVQRLGPTEPFVSGISYQCAAPSAHATASANPAPDPSKRAAMLGGSRGPEGGGILRSVNAVSFTHLVAQLKLLGVRESGVLLVHASFRAVRPVEGGPLGLIAALRAAIGERGTLVMPTMTGGESVFDPKSTPSHDMGVTAELFWRQPGVLRSTHPGGSFAAAGPHAEHICAPQPLSPPHGVDSPVGRVHEHNGQVLLLGVSHSENTTLHLAEAVARVPYSVAHPCVVELDGNARVELIAETDHCCVRFGFAQAWLHARGLQRAGRVGHAPALLCDSRDVVRVAVEQLRRDPLIFLCDAAAACGECDAARASVRG
jgi:aminoglycoside 3-N-acetyltransferase